MKINLVKGVKKRESCFFYRRDTIGGVYRTQVCEKCDFKKPHVAKCSECTIYAPYLSMNDLAAREIERHQFFSQNPSSKKYPEPIVAEKIAANDITEVSSAVKLAKEIKAKENKDNQRASLISFFESKEKNIIKKEIQTKLRPLLERNSVRYHMKEGEI